MAVIPSEHNVSSFTDHKELSIVPKPSDIKVGKSKDHKAIISPTSNETLPPTQAKRRVSPRFRSEITKKDPSLPSMIKLPKSDITPIAAHLSLAPAEVPSSKVVSSQTMLPSKTTLVVKSALTSPLAPRATKASLSTPAKPRRPSKSTPRRPKKKRASRSRTTCKPNKNDNRNTGLIDASTASIPQQPPSGADMTVTQWLQTKNLKMVPNQFPSKPLKSAPLLPLLESDEPQGKIGALPVIERRPTKATDLKTGLTKATINSSSVNNKEVTPSDTVRIPRTLFPPSSKDALKLVSQETAKHLIKPEPCSGVASWLIETNVNKQVANFDDLDITTWEVGIDRTVLDTGDIDDTQGPKEDTASEKWSFETRSFFCVDNIDIFRHVKQDPTIASHHDIVSKKDVLATVTVTANNDKAPTEEASGSALDRTTVSDCKSGHSKNIGGLKSLSIKREDVDQDQDLVSKSMKQAHVSIDAKQDETMSTPGVRVDDSFFLKEEVQDYCPSPDQGSNRIDNVQKEAVNGSSFCSDDQYPKSSGSGSCSDAERKSGKKAERRGSPHSVLADLSEAYYSSLIKIPSCAEMDIKEQGPYLDVNDDPLPIDAVMIPPFKEDIAALCKHRPGYMKEEDSKVFTKLLAAPMPTSVTEDNINDDSKPCPASALFDIPALQQPKSKMTKSQCLKELDSFLFDIQKKKRRVESMAKQIGIDLLGTCDNRRTRNATTADSMGGDQHKNLPQHTAEASS